MTDHRTGRRRAAADRRSRVADAIAAFSGSFEFIALHVVWFTAWIVLNLIPATTFDSFPFGLLTLIVSLEAIFLSTFVLMSQNRSAQLDIERERDNLRVSLRTEVWAEQIGAKLGIDSDEVERRVEQRFREDRDA